ncbi:MAG TPA: hypothetical protein P5165_02585 [Spirochaetia bacterium]|nr:hypothetical protein [Spirochaetales bacterium]HRY72087.1 hypothetical protein [Spirochaetia bacterium]
MKQGAEYLATVLARAAGSVHLPRALRGAGGPFLLHVSDPPSSLYPLVGRLLDALRPAWLLLTGDLADELKLELYPALRHRYAARLADLREVLLPRLAAAPRGGEPGQGLRLLVCAGNHDDALLVRSLFPEALVVGDSLRFRAGGLDCAASHWAARAEETGADYLFYGHDLSRPSGEEGRRRFLNGVSSINVVDLGSGGVFHLPYPAGTDAKRLLRPKIGL